MSEAAGRLLVSAAELMKPHSDAVVSGLVEQVVGGIPELGADADLRESLRLSTAANLTAVFYALETDLRPEDVTAPPAAIGYARRLAQHSISVTQLLRAYRLAVTPISRVFRDYVTRLTDDLVMIDAALRSAAVMRLLGGPQEATPAGDRLLDYDLSARHLGLILWERAPESPQELLPRMEQAVAKISARLRCPRPPLLIIPDETALWAWLPDPAFPVDDQSLAVVSNPSLLIAVGETAEGADGFRFTHERAREAQRIASLHLGEERLWRASAFGPLGMMADDLPTLRGWLRHVLNGLFRDDDGAARLRETLLAYLESGNSLGSAAAQLHLHRNTVRYRVQRAEALQGDDPNVPRRDVEIALLACQLFGATVLPRLEE